jgi:hypothetical protein
LFATKAGRKSITVSLTESANIETIQILRGQLNVTVDLVSTYMINKGYYPPGYIAEQFRVDITLANTVLDKSKALWICLYQKERPVWAFQDFLFRSFHTTANPPLQWLSKL